MATTPVNYYSYQELVPARPMPRPTTEAVKLAPSQTLAAGTVLGQITASGLYKAYASGNSDGSQVAKVILQRACVTDANGNLTDDLGNPIPTAVTYTSGVFNYSDVTGLDATAVSSLFARFFVGALGTANSLFIF